MWRVVPSPSLPLLNQPSTGALIAMKMFASHNVWAIGTAPDFGYVFLEHWNGKSWQITAQHNVFA